MLLAFGLSMDAMAVSAARGLSVRQVRARHVALVAFFFGGFQALMPLIGYLLGASVGKLIAAWDHWIILVVLGGIGAAVLGALADATSITYVYKVCAFLPLIGLLTVFLPNFKHAK